MPDPETWLDRLAPQTALVAELGGEVAGFMTMRTGGHIDLAFVAPNVSRRGIGTALYERIEAEAVRRRLSTLTTDASLVARPFFERNGWAVVREQTVLRAGVSLTNFAMRKDLARGIAG